MDVLTNTTKAHDAEIIILGAIPNPNHIQNRGERYFEECVKCLDEKGT
jgi:hypothetical protein